MSDSVKSVIEWVVRGTPSMVYGVVRSLSSEAGLTVWEIRSPAQTKSIPGVKLPIDVFIVVPIRRSRSDADLGILSLQPRRQHTAIY